MKVRGGHAPWLAGLLLFGAACGTVAPPPAGPVKIRVAMHTYLSYAPALLAQEEGLFAEQGLDVELLTLGRSEQVLAALLAGDVDVWPGITTPGILRAIALGAPIRLVADKGFLDPEGCTYVGLVLRPGLAPESAAGGVRRSNRSREGSYAYVTSVMLASKGIRDEEITYSPLPAEIVPEALAGGQLDVGLMTEPYLGRAAARGTLWIRAQDVLPGYQWGVVMFGARLLGPERDAGVRFLAAWRKAVARLNQGKTPENVAALSRATGMTEAELRTGCWPSFRADGRIQLEGILDYQAWARARGVLDTSASPAMIYDSSLVVASDLRLLGPQP